MINTYYTQANSVLAHTDHDYQSNAAREHVTRSPVDRRIPSEAANAADRRIPGRCSAR